VYVITPCAVPPVDDSSTWHTTPRDHASYGRSTGKSPELQSFAASASVITPAVTMLAVMRVQSMRKRGRRTDRPR
jgi:hypothetical protein